MQHEILAIFPFECVDNLFVLTGPKRCHRERLRLASGEQSRSVSAAKDPDLARDRPHRAGVAAVDPCTAPENSTTDDLLFEILE